MLAVTLIWLRPEGHLTDLDLVTETLRDAVGFLFLRLRQKGDKFFAADAGNQVHAPKGVLQNPGNFAEQQIAGMMAIEIVDELEMIEIEQHQ